MQRWAKLQPSGSFAHLPQTLKRLCMRRQGPGAHLAAGKRGDERWRQHRRLDWQLHCCLNAVIPAAAAPNCSRAPDRTGSSPCGPSSAFEVHGDMHRAEITLDRVEPGLQSAAWAPPAAPDAEGVLFCASRVLERLQSCTASDPTGCDRQRRTPDGTVNFLSQQRPSQAHQVIAR